MSLFVSVPTLSISFAVYGTLKESFLEPGTSSLLRVEGNRIDPITGRPIASLSSLATLMIGASSGICSSMLMFPFDLLRRRLQVRGLNEHDSKSKKSSPRVSATGRVIHEVKEIIRIEGVRGFYRGIVPEILKATPMVAVTFSSYDLMKGFLENISARGSR